jgi:F-type H+-transporting ATPase subunit epsilon
LSDSAELEEDIDVARAKAAKERAETQLRTEHSTEVEADLRRAHARLSAAGGLNSGH